jgi:glutamate dehydrogenase (NAD(P)+)
MGTNAQTMAWMMDAYGQLNGYTPGIVTGKPVELGGSVGRDSATGRGVVILLQELCQDLKRNPAKTTVAIQGNGNVGSWTARLASQAGFPVVALSDASGGVYSKRGLDIDAVERHAANGGKLADFPAGDRLTNDDLLALGCTVLIPAAIGNVITQENCYRVGAEIIIEAANHPMEPEADAALSQRGVQILPDVLANAGGVTVSYFEWTQNLQQFRWDEERVTSELQRILLGAYHQVRDLAKEQGITYRRAAYRIAVERVAQAIRLRGFI